MFVGGMKEGQSYGLRKWFSTHAQGSLLATSLEACNEVLQAGGGLELEPAQLERIRALAAQCRGEIEGISLGYRQRSTAHPHLPFWGRVDTVLNAIESFDPDDDEVCLVDAPEPRRPQHVVDLAETPRRREFLHTDRGGAVSDSVCLNYFSLSNHDHYILLQHCAEETNRERHSFRFFRPKPEKTSKRTAQHTSVFCFCWSPLLEE